MLPPNKRMVLNTEHVVPVTTIRPLSLSRFVDYTAIVASQRAAGKSALTYLSYPAYCFI